jgi:diphthamide biosynthesis enzyme Dph1/Dph2-like protein
MKIMFVEAKRKLNFNVEDIDFSMLPKEVFIAYSIQFKDLAETVKEKLGKKVKGFQQVLGCSKLKSDSPILLIGSGRFHAINLAMQGNSVYVLEGSKINNLNEKEVEQIKGKRKAALARFYAADNIGILVSTKPGQENLKSALELRRKLQNGKDNKNNKQSHIFLANNLNLSELENYNIDSWVNTACAALTFDSKVINIGDLSL